MLANKLLPNAFSRPNSRLERVSHSHGRFVVETLTELKNTLSPGYNILFGEKTWKNTQIVTKRVAVKDF